MALKRLFGLWVGSKAAYSGKNDLGVGVTIPPGSSLVIFKNDHKSGNQPDAYLCVAPPDAKGQDDELP